jgi:hypothetical protein
VISERKPAEDGPQELQSIHILLVIASAAKRRFRPPLQKPVGPLIECELFAGQDSRQTPVVAGVETIPKESLRLPAIGSAG